MKIEEERRMVLSKSIAHPLIFKVVLLRFAGLGKKKLKVAKKSCLFCKKKLL
jgi:hypothetical protein